MAVSAILPKVPSGTVKAEVDVVKITVSYTEGSNENAICYATRSIELTTAGAVRQAPSDDVWGDVTPDGFLPKAIPGALEGRTQRTIVVPSRGDLMYRADSGTPNKVTAQEFTRAGYDVAREAK